MILATANRGYFVCFACNSKFFSSSQENSCPRCGPFIRSRNDSLFESLFRTVIYALRHCREKFLLKMDCEGWTNLDRLRIALRYERREWSELEEADFHQLAKTIGRGRLEIAGNRIRALYGHSFDFPRAVPSRFPPPLLYHGTSGECVPFILELGLRPMERRQVHLTSDVSYAEQIAAAKGGSPFVLRILAREAASHGVRFSNPVDHVWLTDELPARFIVKL